MNMRHTFFLLTAVWISVTLVACGEQNLTPQATDYSIAKHWLKLSETGSKPVDVFYLYPTAW